MYYFTNLLLLFGITACEGEIRVNDRKIALFSPKLTVSDYNAVGTYYYSDGELARISCHRSLAIGNYNYRILFLNVSGTTHETISYGSDVNVYLKLGHSSTPKHIDCTMRKLFNSGHYTIRLIFKPTDQIAYPQFEVNDLILTPSKNYADGYDYAFIYEFYSGEDLIISSKLDTNTYKSVSCSLAGVVDPMETSEFRLNINTDKFANRQAGMDCLVIVANKTPLFGSGVKNNDISISTPKDVRISITFIEDLMKFSPNIIGIPWSKIIAKFKDNVFNKYIVGTFYVSYNSNDNMTLDCSSYSTGVDWIYGAEVNSSVLTATTSSHYNALTNNFISSTTFQLTKNFSQATLECKHLSNTSKVVLIQQKEPMKSTKVSSTENDVNSASSTGITTTIYSNSNDEIKSNDRGLFASNNFLPIIVVVISIIFLLSIITLIVCVCKRKKSPNTDTEINYENLPAHNEGSMPIPTQWDTNRFKNENMEDAYAKVIPKSQRTNLTETLYSEPISEEENSFYATPYNANTESPYAEIIPKSERNGNVPREPANADNYAQIAPKALRNVTSNQVKPKNDDYAENGPKNRNRADTDKHKYANVFNSEVYANVSFNTDAN